MGYSFIFVWFGSSHNKLVGETMSTRPSRHSAFVLLLSIAAVCFSGSGIRFALAELDSSREDRAKNLIVMINDKVDRMEDSIWRR